jgi:hypothetical protein
MKKLVNAAISIIDSVPIIGPAVASELRNLVQDWTNPADPNNGWWNRGTVEYEPTASEEVILTKWNTEKFSPFYKKLAEGLSAALQNQDFAAQVAGINAALNKMCVVRSYFMYNEMAGLSANAVAWRLSLIDELLNPIEDIIENAVSSANLASVQVSVAITDFSPYAPLITGSTAAYTCFNYLGGNAAQNQTFLPVGTTPTAPVQNQEPVKPIIKVPATVKQPITETPKKKTNIWAILGFGALAYYLLSPDGNKKNKDK